ncbi:MAG: choice-of-anchor A family protein [Bacteroidota bacterium]
MKPNTKFFLFVLIIINTLVIHAQSPTNPALGFNIFVEKDVRLATNETEGPVATGRDLILNGSYQVATNNAGNYLVGNVRIALLVGGRVNYHSSGTLQVNQNGYVKIGDSTGSHVWYRDLNGAASPIRITNGVNFNGNPRIQLQANAVNLGVSATVNPVFQRGLVHFAQAFGELKNNALKMSVCNNNAQLTSANGHPISNTNLPNQVKINLNSGINVLNITGADLNRVGVLTYNQKPNANRVLVINVNAPGNFNWQVWNQAGIGFSECPFIIYNFFNTTTLNIGGNNTIEGTVFAPFADVVKTTNQSNIEGQVIAQSFHHSGGEVHYAVFSPNVPGCATPSVASFSVNSLTQCVNVNRFQFTSTSTGTAPINYFWDFGDGTTSTLSNPIKVYQTTGTFNVKHRVQSLGGSDSSTQTVTVAPRPIKGFVVNDTMQPRSTNFFVFTTTTPVPNYAYEWRYGDGSPYGNTVNTTKTYQAAGPYFVCQIVTSPQGCVDTAVTWVVVTSDSCGSGNGGGIESESLGGLVGLREFNYYKNNVNRKVDYQTSQTFTQQPSSLGKKSSALTLQDMFPASLLPGDITRITSPNDLVNITSALEVMSVDYTVENQAKAVVLGIKTKNKAYSHTKYICDRLRGAELLQIDTVTLKGYQFIRYVLKQENGNLEFGTSFVVSTSINRTGYNLQTNWLLAEMAEDDSLYNFQVWATEPGYTNKLVSDIIERVLVNNNITQLNTVKVPQLYVTKGYRRGGKLVLHFRNTGSTITTEMAIEERLHEQANLIQRTQTVTVENTLDKEVELVVNDGYEYSINMLDGPLTQDVVYLADGNWGLDYDREYTLITNFTTANEPSRLYKNSDLSVYRYASVSAISDDYVMLFKGIKQGNAMTDLRPHTHITFYARGNGKLNITLPKDSISRWKQQYYITVDLTSAGMVYNIPFTDFKSDSIEAPFVPNDIRMVMFARGYQGNNGPENMEVAIGNLAFTTPTSGIANSNLIETQTLKVIPNPNKGNFEVSFANKTNAKVQIKLTDVLGRVVYSQSHNGMNGVQIVSLNLQETITQKGIYFLTAEQNNTVIGTQKIIIE